MPNRFTRERVQAAARVGALLFVVAWLLSDRLEAAIPFWLPFVILAAMELEFVARGIRERRDVPEPRPAERRLPGADDADLGWVETVDEEGEPILVAAAPRPPRSSRRPLVLVLVIGIALFAYAYRVDSNAGWPSVSTANRARAERLFTAEAARIAGHPVTVRCDDSYAYTGVGSDAAGVAFIPRKLAYLEPTICRSLYRIAFEHKVGARDDAAFAITVLAHEADTSARRHERGRDRVLRAAGMPAVWAQRVPRVVPCCALIGSRCVLQAGTIGQPPGSGAETTPTVNLGSSRTTTQDLDNTT